MTLKQICSRPCATMNKLGERLRSKHSPQRSVGCVRGHRNCAEPFTSQRSPYQAASDASPIRSADTSDGERCFLEPLPHCAGLGARVVEISRHLPSAFRSISWCSSKSGNDGLEVLIVTGQLG